MHILDTDKQTAKILIVDDSPETIDLLDYFLRPAGYEIFTEMDGESALVAVEKLQPDIILLDAMLPMLDGYAVCQKLKHTTATFHIPIIMITALKEHSDKIRALQAGADDFVTKPFDTVELLARVRSLLRLKFYYDEIIRRNEQLMEQKKRLEKEDRLKHELTKLIVHDMKTPLFAIQGNLQMLNMLKAAGEAISDDTYTKRIERSSDGLLRIILNLLDISRLEDLMLEVNPFALDLPTMIAQSAEPFQQIPYYDNRRFVTDFPRNLPKIRADRALMERFLDNLMNYLYQNAPDYTAINCKAFLEGNSICLEVSHAGTPIPEKFHKKIFSKTAQAEIKKAGVPAARGLGMIFCRMAIEANNGTIRVDPTHTDGVKFRIILPAMIRGNLKLTAVENECNPQSVIAYDQLDSE